MTAVVPTKDSERTIEACLRSLRAQTVPVEIVVVDNHSSDRTLEIATELADRAIVAGPERSAQRNRGAAGGRGSWLLFVDSDEAAHPRVVESCLERVRESHADAAIVPELAEGSGFWARCRRLEKDCYLGDPDIESPAFFARDIFERVGRYDERLHAGEDWDLAERLRVVGATITRCDWPLTHLEGRIRLGETFRVKRYYGGSIALYRKLHPKRASRQMNPFRRAFFRRWRLLARHPILTAGLVVLKSIEFAGIGIGMIRPVSSTDP